MVRKICLVLVLFYCSAGYAISWVSLGGPKELQIRQLVHAGNFLFGSYNETAYSSACFSKLFRFDLATSTWEEVRKPDSLACFVIAGSYGDRIYLSWSSTAYSDDFGGTWKFINGVEFSSRILEINHSLFVATKTGLYQSANGGDTWLPTSQNRIPLYSLAHLGDRFISLCSKGVLISRDTGATWDTVKSGIPYNSSGNMLFGGNNALDAAYGKLYAILNEGIYYSNDSGYTWKNSGQVNSSVLDFFQVKATDSTLYALTDGKLYGDRYIWIPHPTPTWELISKPFSVYCFETIGQQLYAASQNSVYLFSKGRKSLIECNKGFPFLRSLARCWKTNGLLYTGGTWGCSVSDSQGVDWRFDSLFIDSVATDYNFSKFFQSGNTVFMKTSKGISKYDGRQWIRTPGFTNYIVYDACALDSQVFVVTSTLLPNAQCIMWRSIDQGKTWTILDSNLLFGSRSSPTLMTDGQNNLWVWDSYTTAFHSEDAGVHWTKFNAGLPGPTGASGRTVFGFPAFFGSRYLICTDGIYKFNASDSSWTTFNRGLKTSAVGDFIVSDSLLVVLSQNTLYALSPGAVSWRLLAIDSTALLSNSSIQDIFFSNGKILAATTKSGLLQLDLSPQFVNSKPIIARSFEKAVIDAVNHNYLKFSTKEPGSTLKIFNIQGRRLFYTHLARAGTNMIDLTNFLPGVYVCEVAGEKERVRRYFAIGK